MYEQFGVEGVKAYQKTVDYCHSKGLVVIGDVKRGDIGSTSAAYAVGHLGRVSVGSKKLSAFDEDFATVNPYLGSDGVKPFMDVCKQFEAYFLEQCFKEMTKTVGTEEFSSSSTSTLMDYYKDNLIQKIASDSTEQNSLGLAQMLYEQMKRNYNL